MSAEIRQPTSRETPFTVPHFRAWARGLVLDSGEAWEVEPFQFRFLADVFTGTPENWLVIPEGNAKTTLVAGLALYHIQFKRSARVPVAAASRDQAEWLYAAAAGFVERSELEDTFRCLEGYRRIRCDSMGSRIQVFAADAGTGDGAIPTLALIDELHRHRNLNLYRTWTGKLPKRRGQIVAISTAGDPDGQFEETRAKIHEEAVEVTRRGAHTRVVGEGIVLHEYAVAEGKSPDDLRAVKQANPLKALTLADLRRKKKSPTMTEAYWRRFVCGLPSRDVQWVAPEEWDRLKVDIGGLEPGESVYAAVVPGENPAIALAAPRPDDRMVFEEDGFELEIIGAAVKVWISEGKTRLARLEADLLALAAEYDICEIAYDDRQFQYPAEMLEARGLVMVKEAHSPSKLAMATVTLDRIIGAGLLRHDGDPTLRKQVVGAVTKSTEQGWRLVPGDNSRGLIAMALAVHRATQPPDDPPVPMVVVGRVG